MKKVGELLKEERIRKKLSIEEVSKLTRIKPEYIDHIESGEYHLLPNQVYTRGFIKNYAVELGLDPNKIIPFFRREKKARETGTNNIPKQLVKERFQITPIKVVTALSTLIISGFIIFMVMQYFAFSEVPVLIVDSPNRDIVTEIKEIMIVGKTDLGTTVTINGEEIEVIQGGEFNVKYALNDGINRIRVVAINRLGKKSIVERIVKYEIPNEVR